MEYFSQIHSNILNNFTIVKSDNKIKIRYKQNPIVVIRDSGYQRIAIYTTNMSAS